MANILRLPQRRQTDATAAAHLPAEGKVLFFTGVRYQRAEMTAPAPEPCEKRGKSRRAAKPTTTRPRSRVRRA